MEYKRASSHIRIRRGDSTQWDELNLNSHYNQQFLENGRNISGVRDKG